MSTRYFKDFADLGAAMARMALEEHVVLSEAVGIASHVVHHHVTETFGDKTKLAELSPVTIAERESLGYSPDEPLLRDGSLLRDSVQLEHRGLEAGVGSAEPIMLNSERGFVNASSGRSVPPRPVFKIGLDESKDEIIAAIDESIEILITGKPRVDRQA